MVGTGIRDDGGSYPVSLLLMGAMHPGAGGGEGDLLEWCLVP